MSSAGILDDQDSIDDGKFKKLKSYAHLVRALDYDPDRAIYDAYMRKNNAIRIVDIEATLLDGSPGNYKIVRCKNLREYFRSQYFRRYVNERESTLKFLGENQQTDKNINIHDIPMEDLVKIRESTPFDFGAYGDEISSAAGTTLTSFDRLDRGVVQEFLPIVGGPYNKQLYLYDYLLMHSQAFEAYTHNPIAKRIVKIIPQFVLGKGFGVQAVGSGPDAEMAQHVWNSFWKFNRMKLRIKSILRELILYGEQMLKYVETDRGLVIRQLDPSTVWEIVTDPEDIENVFYYHLQYPTQYSMYVDIPIPTMKFVIRQIQANYVDHYKINAVSNEKRGRSELFAILGWLKRLKEYGNDRVIINKVMSMFAWDLTVEGGEAEVKAVESSFQVAPGPGSAFVHNSAVKLETVGSDVSQTRNVDDSNLLMLFVALGAGLSLEYLGLSGASTKAAALVGTEPDIKTFEDYQEQIETIIEDMWLRNMILARKRGLIKNILGCEVQFPEIKSENRSEKLKDIAMSQSMDYLSHQTAANMSAKEQGIKTYDYNVEQARIKVERGEEIGIMQTYQKVLNEPQQVATGDFGGKAEETKSPPNDDLDAASLRQYADSYKDLSPEKYKYDKTEKSLSESDLQRRLMEEDKRRRGKRGRVRGKDKQI